MINKTKLIKDLNIAVTRWQTIWKSNRVSRRRTTSKNKRMEWVLRIISWSRISASMRSCPGSSQPAPRLSCSIRRARTSPRMLTWHWTIQTRRDRIRPNQAPKKASNFRRSRKPYLSVTSTTVMLDSRASSHCRDTTPNTLCQRLSSAGIVRQSSP